MFIALSAKINWGSSMVCDLSLNLLPKTLYHGVDAMTWLLLGYSTLYQNI